MHEADARLHFAAKLRFIEGISLALPGIAAVVEVVGRGDSMLQMIQRAVEAEPIEVVRRIVDSTLPIQIVDPSRQRLLRGQSTIGRLPQMAVGRDESRNHPRAMTVPA